MENTEKKKATTNQKIALGVILLILLVVLITVVSNFIKTMRRDWDGFGDDLAVAYQAMKIEDVKYEDEIFKVFLSSDVYKPMSAEQKFDYCKKIYEGTRNLLVKHKCIDDLESVIMRFYCDGQQVADAVASVLTVYK